MAKLLHAQRQLGEIPGSCSRRCVRSKSWRALVPEAFNHGPQWGCDVLQRWSVGDGKGFLGCFPPNRSIGFLTFQKGSYWMALVDALFGSCCCCVSLGSSFRLVGSAAANGSWFLKSSVVLLAIKSETQRSSLLISHAHVHEFEWFGILSFSTLVTFASNKLHKLPHEVFFFSGCIWCHLV